MYTTLRYLKQNILLCGQWYSREKPSNLAMHTFLRPLMETLNRLYTEGKVDLYVL